MSRRGCSTPVVLTGLLILILMLIGTGVGSFLLSWFRGALASPGLSPGLPNSTGPSEHVTYNFGQVLPRWTGKERVTVLLLGVDERTQETGPWRTDTIMLLTLDPVSLQAGALSIPRDLWVPIPGYKDGRINTAHFLGDLYGHEGGGPALARETVEYNLGVPIDYYVRLNFHGFVTLVNQIGGIEIYVEEAIHDPKYPDYNYGYDPLHIEAGWHHFDGEMALKYARTRHGSSDFDRARRQQQVMLAVLERVTSLELLPQMARSAPQLYETLQTSVATDMALDQMLALGNLSQQVERSEIRFGVLDQHATDPWVTPSGAQVLIPQRDRMREVRDYVFGVDLETGQSVVEEAGETRVIPSPTPEVATVAVLNGTRRAGLAGNTAEHLRAQGITVAHVGNAQQQDQASTLVVVYRPRPLTVTNLLRALQLSSTSVVQTSDPQAAYDIVIVLGADYTGPPQG